MRRRDVLKATAAVGLAAAAPHPAIASPRARPPVPWAFYASVGPRLTRFGVSARDGLLRAEGVPREAAEEVQACWYSSARGVLYVASSDQNTRRHGRHFVEAFRIGSAGNLEPLGASVALPSRPIDIALDSAGRYIVLAHNQPAAVSVLNVQTDGSVGRLIPQPTDIDFGVYPHQIRLFPGQTSVLIPARGIDASARNVEQPGSLRVFDLRSGQLKPAQSVAPDRGMGFRPRHGAFHPGGRWLYVGLESQNRIQAYAVNGDRIASSPAFEATTLAAPARPGQLTSAVVMHPNGRTLYVANRGTGAVTVGETRVIDGENSVAVFSLDRRSGAPTLIQSAAIPGVHARTLAMSPDGAWLVAATIRPAAVRAGDTVITQPAGLTLYRVGPDGRLAFSSTHELDTSEGPVFWVGLA